MLEQMRKRDREGHVWKGRVRFGADFDFEFGRYSLAPPFFANLIGGKTTLV